MGAGLFVVLVNPEFGASPWRHLTRGETRVGDGRMAGAVLLTFYTLVALVILPFAVVLALYAPMLVGSESRPDGPLVVPVMLGLLILPLLLLVGPIGAWVAWARRQVRPAWIFALAPVVYGAVVLIALSVFVG